METLYKLTGGNGEPVHGGSGRWSLPRGRRPGAWRKIGGELVPCQNGLHLLRRQDIRHWLRTGTLWEVEAGTEQIDDGDKVVVRQARLIRRAAIIDAATLRSLAADFAEHVLPIFEKKRPGDMRPREAIAATRAFARGEIGIGEIRKKRAAAYDAAYAAYAAAAYDTAYAADAAAAAAYDTAAYDAAYVAAVAAAATAYAADAAAAAAAQQKEQEWQVARIAEVLAL